MNIAKKCDRCGKMYEQYNMADSEEKPNGMKLLNIDNSQQCFGHKVIDLCPDCMKQLQNWLKDSKLIMVLPDDDMYEKCKSCIHKANYQDEPPCCDCDPSKDAKSWTPTLSHLIDGKARKSETIPQIKNAADSLAIITNAALETRAAELLKENTALQFESVLLKDKSRGLKQQNSALEAKIEEMTGLIKERTEDSAHKALIISGYESKIKELTQMKAELIASANTYVSENIRLTQENVNLKEKVNHLEAVKCSLENNGVLTDDAHMMIVIEGRTLLMNVTGFAI